MVFLKDRLAKYELSVVDYYTDRGAWVAVVNRVEGMMRNYPDTQATRDALPKMENAYRQMQMNAQADKVAKIIAANSRTPEPDSSIANGSHWLPFFYTFPGKLKRFSAGLTHQIWPALSVRQVKSHFFLPCLTK